LFLITIQIMMKNKETKANAKSSQSTLQGANVPK
jgi:hypothetical protein